MKSFLTQFGTDYIFILFLVVVFWRSRKIEGEKDCFITQEDGVSLRGAATLAVMMHHLSLSAKQGILLHGFFDSQVAVNAVTLFFFLSGYGMQKQYMAKGDIYRKNFMKKRFPTVLIPFAVVAVLYWVIYYALGDPYTWDELLSDIRAGIPFVAYSWFMIAIMVFYLFFWLLMSIFRRRVQWMPIAACGCYLLYAFTCIKLKYLMLWYDTAHLFPVGMFFAVHEQKLLKALKNRYLYITIIIIGLICGTVCTLYPILVWPMSVRLYYFVSISRVLSLTTVIVLLQLKIKIDNPVLRYIGKISMETYLLHGLIFYLLRGDYYHLKSEPLFCFLSLGCVILFASLLHPVDNFLLRAWKRAVK